MSSANTRRNEVTQLQHIIAQPQSIPFKVATMFEGSCSLSSYNRREFYKITLMTSGQSHLMYADRDYMISGPALVFTCPAVPYSWELIEGIPGFTGYFCVFADDFVTGPGASEKLALSPLFKSDGNPAYVLTEEQANYIETIFLRMRQEIEGDYRHKFDIIGSQVNLIIHEALKMQPAALATLPTNASARITRLFTALLEKQFPVDLHDNVLQLKKPSDYANKLNIHANHLNAAVQEITGRSTTTHINEKILTEAKSLIKHSDLSIAEIAFSLGFDYVPYFNRFFKKHTELTPMAYRKI